MPVPYDLPRAEDWTGAPVMVFAVDIDNNGWMYVDGQMLSTANALRERADDVFTKDKDLRALIRVSPFASWKYVLPVLDVLKQAGITKIAFGAEASPNAPVRPSTSTLGAAPTSAVWDCAFPAASDRAAIDDATVALVVDVGVDGTALWVQLLNDPGYNFGMAAAQCAMARKYTPAKDDEGNPKQAKTPPIRVRFTR